MQLRHRLHKDPSVLRLDQKWALWRSSNLVPTCSVRLAFVLGEKDFWFCQMFMIVLDCLTVSTRSKRSCLTMFFWKDFGEAPVPSSPVWRAEFLLGDMIKIFLEEVLGSLTWEAFAREGRSTSSSCGVAHPYFTFYEGSWIVIVSTCSNTTCRCSV